MTNADKIRAMTDEELAYFLTTTSCSICCDHPLNCGFECASLYEIKATEQASLLDRMPDTALCKESPTDVFNERMI